MNSTGRGDVVTHIRIVFFPDWIGCMAEEIRYPRKILIRTFLRTAGRALVRLLTRPKLSGMDHFPEDGPVILVGNHTGALEVVYMTLFSPRQVEYIGGMDIPHEPFIAVFIKLYGLIPVLRGRTSRTSVKTAVDVLAQGAFLGVFPEGGIWEPAIRDARTGVAWLSYHAQAPVLPIGFASTQGGLHKVMRLQRPEVEMNVGQLIPPVTIPAGKPRKQHFQDAANAIMDAVWALVPDSAKQAEKQILDERFEFRVDAFNPDGSCIDIPRGFKIGQGPALSKFLHRPTLFNNLRDNLSLPVHALQHLHDSPSEDDLLKATGAILSYLEDDNPYYFTYRYGQQEGSAMQQGVQELHNLVLWAADKKIRLKLAPIRRYRTPDSPDDVVLDRSEEIKKW
ncbi:MAG: 1-acyl-sn-glycerol-3-phosphate acyltransferase [Anaerolineales bacterium]|nr:1-acyl-sn-glycerol-3-phosphate acyltransferase [Anaerolineales bacterium]